MAEFLQLMENWDGFTPVSDRNIDEAAVARFNHLSAGEDARGNRIPSHLQEYLLREVITTSNFPAIFGFTLERDMLARYRAATADWRAYCATGTLPNFNQGEFHQVIGNDTLLPFVAEKGEYLIAPMRSALRYRRVYKWGRQFDISWEAMINDALGAFSDIPNRFADSVTYTRALNVTDLYASAAGPDVGLFGAPIVDSGQNVTNLGALPLTPANLEATLGLMAAQTDPNGRPLSIRGVHVVVGPLLEIRLRQILTSAYWDYAATAAAATPLITANVLPQMGIQAHVDPLLPVVDLSGNRNFTWYVFADPSQGKAIQMDFLRGNEDPEICMKASDKVAVGGAGPLSQYSGDFATDNVFFRVRDVHGGTRLDPRFAYAQVAAA